MATLQLRPSDIRYSQDSISIYFRDDSSGTILDLFEKIINGEINVSFLPRIQVADYDGNWMAFEGNRRLFVFKVQMILFLLYSATIIVYFHLHENIFTD